MSHVGDPRGRTCSRTFRSVALLATGVLALPALSACSAHDDNGSPAPADISSASRGSLSQGGTVQWAVDSVPATLNAFQADADASTSRIAGAVLPSLYTLDKRGAPRMNTDYLESAKVVDREPKQVVEYHLDQQAVWSDGREIGAPDFVAQWQALRGKNSAFWTARNAGYDRIEKIQRGKDDLDVKVTFSKPYADWKSLFTPLYPKDVMGTPSAFNDGARAALKTTAGPFKVKSVDRKANTTTLVRNARWWGAPAKLDTVVLRAVPMGKRAAQLASGELDVADIDAPTAQRISSASGNAGAPVQPAAGAPAERHKQTAKEKAEAAKLVAAARAATAKAAAKLSGDKLKDFKKEQNALKGFRVRKSLEPAYTQLAMNGETGPLADDRVRRAVARAIDRQKLANAVLKPLGLPAKTLGSHLAVVGQPAYADASDALGEQDTQEAQTLLGDAGWTQEGARQTPKTGSKAGSEGKKSAAAEKADTNKAGGEKGEGKAGEEKGSAGSSSDDAEKADTNKAGGEKGEGKAGEEKGSAGSSSDDAKKADTNKANGTDMSDEKDKTDQAGKVDKAGSHDQSDDKPADRQPGGMAGAYAPAGTAAPAAKPDGAVKTGPLGKDGRPLTLRFVLPSGQGSERLRAVGDQIARMLDRVGIDTEITKVPDASFFKDYIASGAYDLALYSWPATAYPATDGRPIYAKPQPAADGSLLVEQNYTRVGTDRIDQLFDQAAGELDQEKSDSLLKQADARIWAAAGSIPLYQRPQLVAVKDGLRNVGAFGLASPRYQNIGFTSAKGRSGPRSETEVLKKK